MGENLIKPYEISVWEEKLIQIEGSEPARYKFEETKIAIIGSDTMTGYNKIYNPVFHKKSNGEKTLSFSLHYKYFDPYSGNEDVINPFAALLVNERKVKLHYDGKWYEFVIKDHTESSDGLEWTYTCTDAFVLELSKRGYNITFDSELNNNQGTARELALETIEDTDWQLGGVDTFKQLIAEPVYKATLLSKTGITVINASKDGTPVPENGASIYLFYSYVKNQDGKNVQFIIYDENKDYTIDDNNVITDTNFRITTELTYKNNGFYMGNTPIISIGEIETRYQVNRLAYNQLTTYDPVIERTVERFKVQNGDLEVYKYTDYTYTTSNVVMNYITNGDNFNALEDGTLQGWNPYTDQSGGATVKKLELITKPELATGKALATLKSLSEIEGFLKVQFNGAKIENGGKIYNTVYNSGIQNHGSLLQSISKGQKFVFRWRAGQESNGVIGSTTDLRVLVAKYTQDTPTAYGYYYKHIKTSDVILDFNSGTPKQLNNYIEGGTIVTNSDNTQSYVVDGVAQVPSTKYIYKVNNTEYVWQGSTNTFINNTSSYRPYYYLTATAKQAISNAVLSDPSVRIGIFIYTNNSTNSSKPYFIQDIQLTQFIADSTDATGERPLTIGNAPVATSESKDYYYIKPSDGMAAEDVKMYASLGELQTDKGINNIVALYNEDSEKTLSITASQSNCFNILQTIAETFECWVDLVVDHNEQGYITSTENKPNKYVYLREYAGKDNWAGFKYGINLESIERNINSEEIVTKLIVDMSQSDLVDEGYVSIANAKSNQSGESYILNFDYYYNQGLLNKEEAEEDRLQFTSALKDFNNQLQEKEKERRNLEAALTAVNSQRNVYTELVETAKDSNSEALSEFEQLANMSYSDYQGVHTSRAIDQQLTEDETIYETLGKIYTTSSVINNYGGLLTNVDKEYADLRAKLYGTKNYKVRFWAANDANNQRHVFVEFNDYDIAGVMFNLGSSYSGTVTVSQKYFDITSIETSISFKQLPSGYSLSPNQNSYTITTVPQTVRIRTSSSITGIIDEIEEIQEGKDRLTTDFNNKYSRYIQEGTWNSTDYIDSELYYLDAMQVSNTSAQPTVSYTINVVEVSELEGLEDYLFDVGDKTYIEDTEFFGWHGDNIGTVENPNIVYTPAREEVIVSEVEWHLEEPENNTITVQNYKTRFEDLFQRISAAVQTVQYNEATYAKISTLMDADGKLNQNVLLDSLNRISGKEVNLTTDGSIQIHGDEILIHNLTNNSNFVKINGEGIRISSDGGQNWTTAIDGRGINIGVVYTGSLNTDQVIIGNENNPSFRWDKSGISAYRFVNRVEPTRRFMSLRAGVEDDSQGYDLQTFVRFDQYGLYGIKNNGSFKASSLEDVKDKAHFAVTWDGFFIKNSYTGGGRVEITSENDFRVLKTVNNEEKEVIKIGALEWGNSIVPISNMAPTLYGIRITNDDGIETFKTGNDGNITITGTINALGGNFSGLVNVGPTNQDHIIIDGRSGINSPLIASSNYQDGAGYGWMINKDGDAVFNNITARGAIKTAVFEYAEIQAVGGIFIFRPSSTIRNAARAGETDDITITVEKPYLFNVGDWCKISNYTDSTREPNASAILANNGLTHVYKIKSRDSSNTRILVLENAYTALTSGTTKVINDITDLIGGALVDMGNKANGNGQPGTNNYGIGINSSDNVVDLPRRAISLFETVVDETKNPKVSYNYRGILGTLPIMNSGVDQRIYQYMQGTQGIYTDNMYLGNNNQYLAFYEDENGNKQLRIRAKQLMFETADSTPENPQYHDVTQIEAEGVPGPAGQDAIRVEIESSAGNIFTNPNQTTHLKCYVYKGTQDITDTVTSYTWLMRDQNGNIIDDWHPIAGREVDISAAQITAKGVITCEVNF